VVDGSREAQVFGRECDDAAGGAFVVRRLLLDGVVLILHFLT
jgi:hypothetical protein